MPYRLANPQWRSDLTLLAPGRCRYAAIVASVKSATLTIWRSTRALECLFSNRLKDAHAYSTHGLHLPYLNTFVVPNAANIAVFGSSQEGDQPLYELLGQQAYNNVCGLSVRRLPAPRNRTVPCFRNRTSLYYSAMK